MAGVNRKRRRLFGVERAQPHVARRRADTLQAHVLADRLDDVDLRLELLDEIHGLPNCFGPLRGSCSYSATLESRTRMMVPDPAVLDVTALDDAIAALPEHRRGVPGVGGRSLGLSRQDQHAAAQAAADFEAGRRPRRSLNLREVVTRVDYWLTGSRFESALVHYALARKYFPEDYERLVKLRMPSYVKLVLANEFPRTQVTTRLTAGRALLLRTVSYARRRRAFRKPVPGSFSDPPLPGKSGAERAASRLHLRRNEHVPAPVPARGDRARST